MFEREYRDLASVPRWGIIPTIKQQSVAEHSYYVALYTSHILKALDLGNRFIAAAMHHAVEHDRAETYTGDIPGPVKRAIMDATSAEKYEGRMDSLRFTTYAGVKIVEEQDRIVLAIRKLADVMDEYAFWNEEKWLGNQRATKMLSHIYSRMIGAAGHLGEVSNNENNVWRLIIDPFMASLSCDKILPEDRT